MTLLSLTQKLCMAGWLLAAAMLVAINAVPFTALDTASTEGDPANLVALRAQLSLLESLSVANLRRLSDRERLQSFFAAYQAPKDANPADIMPSADTAQSAITPGETALPGLTGVLQREDGRGRLYYLALLDGRVCAERDEVRMFTVGTITAAGVVLRQAGMQWFLPCPQPYYTSDQGR